MYRLTLYGSEVVRKDGAHIPSDQENTDYREYLAWCAAGNAPDPADQPAPEPAVEPPPSLDYLKALMVALMNQIEARLKETA